MQAGRDGGNGERAVEPVGGGTKSGGDTAQGLLARGTVSKSGRATPSTVKVSPNQNEEYKVILK